METNVNLRHVDATAVELPAPQPKPTSISGQLESSVDVWADDVAGSGVWECGPGEFTADRSGATEVCHIISGSGTVVGEDGTRAEIGPGSLLVLPRGWRGTWMVRETIRKTYVLVGV
ncbi:cupin domain-containing protein [Mycobacterium sp. NPDC003449]